MPRQKKTVNFDDPKIFILEMKKAKRVPSSHFLAGQGVPSGRNGNGLATHIGYAVPKGALNFLEKKD